MRLYRILTSGGHKSWAAQSDNGLFELLSGDFPNFSPSGVFVEAKKLLAPVEPPAIYAIGLNYRAHAAESGSEVPRYPVIFMKAPSCLCGPQDAIELPRALNSTKVDYEVELAFVIGKRGKNIPERDAMSHIFGLTIANDVSARDWQKHAGAGQWTRGKCFDTSLPVGPSLVTLDEIADAHKLRLSCHVNGELRQSSSTSDLIFTLPQIVAFLSLSNTLEPGTLVITGTPAGVAMGRTPSPWLAPGDVVRCGIEGLGEIENGVIDEPLS